ncbi:MAG TPA: TldD/PmbA family protein [Fibrobacter sp.]|nr:TldD/PmbA family protein [Fibrobacter sp.]
MNIQEAVYYLKDLASKKVDQFDIIAGHHLSEGLSLFKSKVQNTEISESVGLGIRVFKNGSPGYAHTERLTEEAISQTLDDALSHTAFTNPIQIDLPDPQKLTEIEGLYNADLKKITLSDMTSFCLEIEKQAFEASTEIENIPYLGADRSESALVIANHKGVFYERFRNNISAGVGCVAERDGIKKVGIYSKAGMDWSLFDSSFIAKQSVERALELLSPSSIAKGKHPVIFSERVASGVVSMYASSFFADSIQKGQSRLQDLLDKKIAPEFFHLSSEPFRTDFSGSCVFDGEGVPTQKIEVVQSGVFRKKLYNLESAARDGVLSTGSASRSYNGKVETSFKNLVVSPGMQSTEELLKLFPNCLLIVKLEGNSGCSAISGEMSIGAQGIWYENGSPVHAVDGITLCTNFFDLLERLVAVGSTYNDSFSSVKVPALAVSEMAVSS